MPSLNPVVRSAPVRDLQVYNVKKNGAERQANILQRREDEVYVHYIGTDKRMDEWVPEDSVKSLDGEAEDRDTGGPSSSTNGRKRKRAGTNKSRASSRHRSLDIPHDLEGLGLGDEGVPMTEEEYDIQHHKQITAQRNFDKVYFAHFQIKTWYFSPYPLTEQETEDPPPSASSSHPSGPSASTARIPGVARSSTRAHGRTSDILAGGLRRNGGGEKASILWVCDRCFKYMADGASWDMHAKKCTRTAPPGRKVYQRGAHIIWEVDGAKEKLYCQNLSLFGKLFIDIKTLFFDCDNFLFYILTDADSTRDHVIGFFSKEKVSYDDYNLACIVTLPPFQRKGYGMLLIEFSYELSRRAGKVGTPERPLSDLGLRSYLTYWVSTLIRFFRRLLSVLPPEHSHFVAKTTKDNNNFLPMPDLSLMRTPSGDSEDSTSVAKVGKKARKSQVVKFDYNSEMADPSIAVAPPSAATDEIISNMRTVETTSNPDGSATSHVFIRLTLTDIASATNIRVEDVGFAMNECGLLVKRYKGKGEEGAEEVEEVIMVSREMVEAVARERKVKRTMIELECVML